MTADPATELKLAEWVRAATLAPSPDNNQPWRFMARGQEVLVAADMRRHLPSDAGGMFMLLSLGAAVENLAIAASHDGYAAQVEWLAGAGWLETGDLAPQIARVRFGPGAQADPFFGCLALRATCRRPYEKRPPEPSVLGELEEAARRPGVQVDWVTARHGIRAMARLVAAGDRVRLEHKPFHTELYRQLRFSASEAELARDGLDLRTLELPPGAGWLLEFLRPWQRMKLLMRLRLSGLLALPSRSLAARSGAVGVLSTGGTTPADLLEGGRALERLWLAAQRAGLQLHPLGSLPVFFAHLAEPAESTLGARKLAQIERLHDRIDLLLPAARGRRLAMLFRLGYAPPPRYRSLRRPLAEVLS